MAEQKSVYEKIEAAGDQLLARAKKLIREGNARRLRIRNREGQKLLDVPLTVGIIGAILVPGYAALGVIAAMATGHSVVVERSKTTNGAAEVEQPQTD